MMDKQERSRTARALEVFRIFLLLGITSFGGPLAHIGFFREAFVARRYWMSDAAYADLVALCNLLPGPTSSQVGMAIGLQRAGPLGLLAAWAAFTLPSAILLLAFAFGATALTELTGDGWIAGLKAAAVAVVAQALIGMTRSLTPDWQRLTIATFAGVLAYTLGGAIGQVSAILFGAAASWFFLSPPAPTVEKAKQSVPVTHATAVGCLILFALLLVLLPLVAGLTQQGIIQTTDRFYRAGALVFGGGHVVLPLLQAELVGSGLVGRDSFLAGYGAAQAVPGPLFSFAAYLGALQNISPTGIPGAAVALAAIYLPSALLVMGALPFWAGLRQQRRIRQLLLGVNAAVVGLLAAAFYDPVLISGVPTPAAAAFAVAAYVSLTVWKLPAWTVVLAAGFLGFIFL